MRLSFLLTLFLLMGCDSASGDQDTTPLVVLYMVDDFSTTRKDAQTLTEDLAVEYIEIVRKANHPVHAMFSHVSQPHPNPATCDLQAFTETMNAFDTDLPDKKRRLHHVDSMNSIAIQHFREGFNKKFRDFSLTPENDYSYIRRHLRAIAHTLSDTTVQAIRIAVIATDFVDHELGAKPATVDADTIQMLNDALTTNPNARLFVITDIDTTDTPLSQLRATFLSSWTELKPILNNQFPNIKNSDYVPH